MVWTGLGKTGMDVSRQEWEGELEHACFAQVSRAIFTFFGKRGSRLLYPTLQA